MGYFIGGVLSQGIKMGKANKVQPAGMHDESGKMVEMYIPRKCSATNRLIEATDHAAVQINVGDIDDNGTYTGKNKAYALAGFIREKAGSDQAINRLCLRDRILREK